ncbi:MAG: hypothetical protein M1812_001334 [Candelaria pacifica]|nr:MAG: hypothetical protein M1812_001334 [Candelaria pacifica]
MHDTNGITLPIKAGDLQFNSIEDSIEAFRRGEFIVVLDSQDRENEGDLIIAAEDITTEKMAFMIRYTRYLTIYFLNPLPFEILKADVLTLSGIICTPISSSQTTTLSLPQMVAQNADPNRTAYTLSIDASHPSITTGISAHDRALTCRTLAFSSTTSESFRRPGHVFPLRARDGGVSERSGHTEAAVDFCRLSGKAMAGVICELVEDGEEVPGRAERRDGGMMRRDGCLKFGKRWGLKVCTIEDLVNYLGKHEGGMNGISGTG